MTTFTYDTAPYEQMLGATLGSYRLERELDLTELGPTYLARGGASNATYRLRLLTAGTNLDSRERAAYLEHAGELAAQLATLQHPNILSLVDSGVYRGLPYLIYPNLAMRSLSTLVTEDGPMDSTTAGRYVGQAARALDYAHGRGILHGDLSTDCIYLQADGQIVVADFSVRRMIELAQRQGGDNPAAYSAEACAPEQLLGEAVGPATDVYALGAALFRLLSGEPVYRGATHEQIAEQHLRAPIPTLSARRPDLPRQLDTVLAHAMAKEPAERFPQATLLADALDQAAALGAQAPNSRPMGKSAPSSRPMGKSVPSSRPADMRASDMRASNSSPLSGQGAAHANGSVGVAYVEAAVAPGAPIGGPGVAATQRPPSAVRWWTAALIITLIAVIAGSIFALRGAYSPPASVAGTGQAFFQDAATGALGHSDAIRITSTGLSKPPSGSEYDAWLIDTQSERVIALGTLASSDGGKTYNVSYARAAAETGGVNLLAVADLLEVTLEQGHPSVPVGKVMLQALFPHNPTIHIRHLLFSFDSTPGAIGFMVGVLLQTQVLDLRAQALQKAAAAHDTQMTQCEAQAMVNILEGAQGRNYRALGKQCPTNESVGDGYGVLPGPKEGSGYLSGALEHTSLVTSQPEATSDTRAHAPLAVTALNNVKTWLQIIEQDAVALAKTPADTSKVAEMVTLAAYAYRGVDANHDGMIDPIQGEAGALSAYQQAQLMATLQMTPPKASGG